MTALVYGSLAFDNVMTFQDRFVDHILPDQIHILNVSFLVPGMKRDYGGCVGNIAYNLRLPVESRARLPFSKSSTKAGRTISSRRTIFLTAV